MNPAGRKGWEVAMRHAIAINVQLGWKAYRVGLYARHRAGGLFYYEAIPVPAVRAER